MQLKAVVGVPDLMTNYLNLGNAALSGEITESLARTVSRQLDGIAKCATLIIQHQRMNRGRKPEGDLKLMPAQDVEPAPTNAA